MRNSTPHTLQESKVNHIANSNVKWKEKCTFPTGMEEKEHLFLNSNLPKEGWNKNRENGKKWFTQWKIGILSFFLSKTTLMILMSLRYKEEKQRKMSIIAPTVESQKVRLQWVTFACLCRSTYWAPPLLQVILSPGPHGANSLDMRDMRPRVKIYLL